MEARIKRQSRIVFEILNSYLHVKFKLLTKQRNLNTIDIVQKR